MARVSPSLASRAAGPARFDVWRARSSERSSGRLLGMCCRQDGGDQTNTKLHYDHLSLRVE